MTSTTLMTFLLCTSPNVRSVKLLGSWDNFAKPYVMERDKRVGAGHWRGCHTFTNITCDGMVHNTLPARSGGLKMGGTYWYYYLLDDDIEHYNEAQPMTTHCPFLPGQPVNVLQVPIILPDTHLTRARSPSAQRTVQTMNPEDKYMNPREPPKPKLRLRTSPPLLQTPTPNWSFSTSPLGAITSRGASQPAHTAHKFMHPRSEEKASRSVSPPRSKGLRAAFRQWNGSTPNISPKNDQDGVFEHQASHLRPPLDDRHHARSQSNDSYMRSPSIGHVPEFSDGGNLPFRRPVSAGTHDSASLSIQERRAMNTNSPDRSTPRNPLTLRPKQPCVVPNNAGHSIRSPFMRRPLSTPSTPSMFRRPSGDLSSPKESMTPTPVAVVNKRLPTLPNSPSSVMDEALRELEEKERALDMEALASHFSDFTETESVDGDGPCEKSRFSEWSADTDIVSPESMTSSSTFNEKRDSPAIPAIALSELSDASTDVASSDPNTPHLTVDSKSPVHLEDSTRVDFSIPRLTIALSPSDLSIPGLYINEEDEGLLESNPKRHAAFFEAMELKGLGLTSPPASTLRFPEGVQDVMSDRSITPTDDPGRYSMLLSQSATMQEMIDELSYLKNMIQSGAAPDLWWACSLETPAAKNPIPTPVQVTFLKQQQEQKNKPAHLRIRDCTYSINYDRLEDTLRLKMAQDGSPTQPQLTPVGEKSLPAKCKEDMITYCPSMDLIALVTEDEELGVFRLNGQKVFGGSYKGDPYLDEDDGSGEIRAVRWKNNGHLLAVACADSTVRIISAYSGKTAHHYRAHGDSGEQSLKMTCLGWGVNFTDSKVARRQLHEAVGQLSVDDLLSLDMQPSKAAALLKADLPRELALLDIESSLPRLSTLPSTGSDDDVFSSRASIDAIFHSSQKAASGAVDVLLVGFEDGTVHLRIFDCFEIGSVLFTSPAPCAILQHASHPLSSTHALVASSGNNLRLLTLDLRFITRSGRYLSLLAHKTTQLQSLLRYICQVQRQIEMEWKNAQELPARYMRSVNQDLEEKCHCDFVTAAYHLVGHKRWEKAVATGYEIVRRLTHECLLPALERCEVLLSRLTGLSKFQKLSEVLGLETSDLKAIVETLDCLHLLAHHIIISTNEELTQFHAFSRWIRHQIDMLSAEPMSQTLEELMEKTDLVEYPLTLRYIRGALTKSSLRNYIQQLPMMGFPRPPVPSDDKLVPTKGNNRSFYDMFKELLEQQNKAADDAAPVILPKLNNLTKRLGVQFEKVFSQIAVTQKRGILHRSPLTLHRDCDKTVFDSTMRYEEVKRGEQLSVIYVASRLATSRHLLYIYRVVLDLENGVSSTREARVGVVNFHDGIIRQVQFAEGDNLMILWSNNVGVSYILQLPFQPSPQEYPPGAAYQLTINYHDVHHVDAVKEMTDVDIQSSQLVKHQFAPKARPVKIEVNGRQGRRAICVLYAGALRYEVLDLDAEMGDDEDEEGDE
ncbi:uncharacterized protein DSM5745_01955 [Aspergillus mulundensis]|uniref:Anaphase-promoting complex subunit 4 n=1 Tax=Aspergillus mulundensis TaxID=1810919 RepID=A0A3D8SV59_9EURO|nr:hypothetical protein DSM5745_01955 [Aspergillus mulundensis]RDW90180.1 hypothetical protein DSM5745_01955 [Aspergillus mulundensis]